MNDKVTEFDKKFPSLSECYDEGEDGYTISNIEEYCLDKQRTKDIINKLRKHELCESCADTILKELGLE